MNTKRTALVLAHRDGRMRGNKAKSRTSIVHEIERKVKRLARQLIVAAGAGGLGLAVGSAMPALLGVTGWRPGLTLAGLSLLAIGCAVEVMGE